MKRSLLNNLSANTLQLIINQLFALIIFYVLSTQLEKAGFGQINMVLAILLAVFNILSLGIDQLVIKRWRPARTPINYLPPIVCMSLYPVYCSIAY